MKRLGVKFSLAALFLLIGLLLSGPELRGEVQGTILAHPKQLIAPGAETGFDQKVGLEYLVLGEKTPWAQFNFTLERGKTLELWGLFYFPYGTWKSLLLFINGKERPVKGASLPYWLWVPLGRESFKAGRNYLRVRALKPGVRLARLALYPGEKAFEETWYQEADPLFSQEEVLSKAKFLPKHLSFLSLQADDFLEVRGKVKRGAASGGLYVEFSEAPEDTLATLVRLEAPRDLSLWVRVYFDAAAATLGDANSFWLSLDSRADRVQLLTNDDYDRWQWLRVGRYRLEEGLHLLRLMVRETPVRIDQVVLFEGENASAAAWYRKRYPEALPLAIANPLPPEEAPGAGGWRAFGASAQRVHLSFIYPGGGRGALRVSLPPGSGEVILERKLSLRTAEAFVNKHRAQALGLRLRGLKGRVSVHGVYQDREGEEFEGVFEPELGPGPWHEASLNLGGDTRYPRMRRDRGDGILDFPLSFRHLILRNLGEGEALLEVGEISFRRPFGYSVRLMPEQPGLKPGGGAVVEVRVEEEGSAFRAADLSWSLIKQEKEGSRRLAHGRRSLSLGGSLQKRFELPLDGEGIYAFRYAIAADPPRELLFAVGETAEAALKHHERKRERAQGAFRFDPQWRDRPLRKPDGSLMKREEVASLYGKEGGISVEADGLDVTTREYALKRGGPVLRPRGFDLSHRAGWPEVGVPPGVLAIDPVLGRLKFPSISRRRLVPAGSIYTGFGVPGSGRPFVREPFLFMPPGEGDLAIFDIEDKASPKVVGLVPSSFFFSYILPFRKWLLFNVRQGNAILPLPENPRLPGRIRISRWKAEWGRGVHDVLETEGLGYTVGKDNLYVLDLEDPLSPRMVGRVPASGIGGFRIAPDRSRAFALLQGGKKVGIFDLKDPRRPTLRAEWDNLSWKDRGGSLHFYRPASFTRKYLLLHSKRELALYDIGKPSEPRELSRFTFPEEGTYIRDAAIGGENVFVLDGRRLPSQHSLHRGHSTSRLLVLKIGADGGLRIIGRYEEEKPTEYSYITLSGPWGYVNDYNFGLWVFDLRDPGMPKKIGGAPGPGEGHWALARGEKAMLVQTFGGSVIFADLSEVSNPKPLGFFWDGEWLDYRSRPASWGPYAILARLQSIIALDWQSSQMPPPYFELKGEGGRSIHQGNFKVFDSRLYVAGRDPADGRFYLGVYELGRPPKLKATLQLPSRGRSAWKLEAEGERLYLLDTGEGAIHIFSIEQPLSPRPVGSFSFPTGDIPRLVSGDGRYSGLAASRGYLYIAPGGRLEREPAFHILDVRDPKNIRYLKAFHLPRGGWQHSYVDLLARDPYLFGSGYSQMDVFDIRNPTEPRLIITHGKGYQWTLGSLWRDYILVPKLRGLEIFAAPRASQVPWGEVRARALQ